MSNFWVFNEMADATAIPNMASWQASNKHNEGYMIQASWPLGWSNVSQTQGISDSADVVYVELTAIQESVTNRVNRYTVDGNAMFMSATDVVRRRQTNNPGKIATIVIAISYLLTDSVYSTRRNYDLTPPSKSFTVPSTLQSTLSSALPSNLSSTVSSTVSSVQPSAVPPAYGGADELLDFINKFVKPFVFGSVFPNVTVDQSALFGHSLGGLFALHTLFTAPESFDTYLAASPSIFWNDKYILTEEKKFLNASGSEHQPNVWLSYGTLEQDPKRQKGQTELEYAADVSVANYTRMTDNVEAMSKDLEESKCDPTVAPALEESQCIKSVKKRVYQDEDHPSVVAPALGGALEWFKSL